MESGRKCELESWRRRMWGGRWSSSGVESGGFGERSVMGNKMVMETRSVRYIVCSKDYHDALFMLIINNIYIIYL